MNAADRAELEATIDWMRANGVAHLEWDGLALSIDLRHAAPSSEELPEGEPKSLRQAAQEVREKRRSTLYGPRVSSPRPREASQAAPLAHPDPDGDA